MIPKKIQDIIVQRPGSKIPLRVSAHTASSSASHAPFKSVAGAGRTEDESDVSSGGGRKGMSPVRYYGYPPEKRPSRKKSRIVLWGAVVCAVVVLVFAFSTFFEKATLKIFLKQTTSSLDSIIVARKGTEKSETAKSTISFEGMTLSDSASREVQATALQHVERRASGSILVYNDFSKESQRLIKNTRFESADGKIYRIHESVVVPGQKTEAGKTVPGSVEVTVYADEPGVAYNIGLSDFTIPGFKGSPRFEKFYGRGKTEMNGGFSGEMKTLGDAELAQVTSELRKELEGTLRARARGEVPEDFVLFDDAIFTVFETGEPLQNKDGDTSIMRVTQSASLYALLFNKPALNSFIIDKLSYKSEEENGARVTVDNLLELDFSIIDKTNFSPETDTQFSFTLKGKPHLAWEFNRNNLLGALRTVPQEELATVLVGFPEITRAEVTFRPFWKRSFPGDTSDIEIESSWEE